MKKSYPEIRGKVTSKIDVLIKANDTNVDLNQSFYAINWFDTKIEWMYHFYNFLASRSVVKIGGIPFFKAKIKEVLSGDAKDQRELLLIVRYPNGNQFKALMQSTYFKMVSIFRIFSVTKFTFGFTHEIVSDQVSKKADDLYYAIHHFKTKKDSTQVINELSQHFPEQIQVKYAGAMVANLYSHEKNKEAEQIPNLMDAIIIVQSKDEDAIRSVFSSTAYQYVMKEFTSSSFISLLNRIF